ncbi:MAG: YiiX/YebB-like N1pC/P60 family cysteine hydrolase [Fermentimonas sp.]
MKIEINYSVMCKLRFPVFLILAVLVQACGNVKDRFELQTGDLLFSVGKENSELLIAIQNSTGKDKDVPFTHVGIVSVEEGKIYVLEATAPEGVIKTTLEDFFGKTATLNDNPLIAVGRVKKEFEYTITNAIKNAEKHLGKRYDYVYSETNDQFYCSELVRFAFLDLLGNPIFEPLAMSFINTETGTVDPYWVKHFEKLGEPVPEGEPGTNPADMVRSPVIDIVHEYY